MKGAPLAALPSPSPTVAMEATAARHIFEDARGRYGHFRYTLGRRWRERPCLCVRFRSFTSRLQVNIVETRRDGGRVRHVHFAGLGSIEMPLTVADRIAFWKDVYECLGRLGNRIDADTQARLLGAVHGRIPMVTPEEQRASANRPVAPHMT
jgi:hypothetical protein